IGRSEIDPGWQPLLGEAGSVDGPRSGIAQRALHRQHAPLPRGMKDRLVRLGLHLSEPVHAAHVVNAVHQPPSSGRLGSPVPIIASRVTSCARRSSLQPSVPGGRIGSTRNRVSAVESQTRISVLAGSLMPKSARTPRGSFTARERKGADLYQTGGSPST